MKCEGSNLQLDSYVVLRYIQKSKKGRKCLFFTLAEISWRNKETIELSSITSWIFLEILIKAAIFYLRNLIHNRRDGGKLIAVLN
jgi:hypothetical protein